MAVDILFYDSAGYIHSDLLPGALDITAGFKAGSLPGISLYHASGRELAFNRRMYSSVSCVVMHLLNEFETPKAMLRIYMCWSNLGFLGGWEAGVRVVDSFGSCCLPDTNDAP